MFITVTDTTKKKVRLNAAYIVYIEEGEGVSCVYMIHAPSVFLNHEELEKLLFALEQLDLIYHEAMK